MNSPAPARTGNPVSVLMIDLDRFKSINDTHGHLAGDAVLREAARRLKSAARRYDSVGRYGGEEFLVVLPGCDAADAALQAERMREAIGATPFLAPSPTRFPSPLSLGVACVLSLSLPKPLSAKPTTPSMRPRRKGAIASWSHSAA